MKTYHGKLFYMFRITTNQIIILLANNCTSKLVAKLIKAESKLIQSDIYWKLVIKSNLCQHKMAIGVCLVVCRLISSNVGRLSQ